MNLIFFQDKSKNNRSRRNTDLEEGDKNASVKDESENAQKKFVSNF